MPENRASPSRSSRRFADARIDALAKAQHAVVSRRQLLGLGVSPGAITRRIGSGHLRVRHRGVYLVGPIEWEYTTEMAAVLAGGPVAALSHTSAARLFEILPSAERQPVHVTVPGSGRGRRAGIVFHRARNLASDESTVLHGIRITAPPRTIVDIAGMLGSREVEQAVAAAERHGLITDHDLDNALDRYRGRPGMPLLRDLVLDRTGARFTRSEAERRCLDLLRQAGLPRPHTNVSVGPYELDLFWPDEGVALEIDGRRHHASRARFEGDRRKDMWLRARGIDVIRLSWNQITGRAVATAAQVAQTLALARHAREAVQAVQARKAGAAR